jgi:DNA polymerase-3 subunit alpha
MVGFLYGQTEYSILENAIHLDDYINHGVENGFSFLTITDSNMHGHLKFYNACKKNNIKPIIGLRVKISSTVDRLNCVLLYAKNKKGYQNLLKISTEQELNKVVSDEFISRNNEGLILVTSAIESDLDFFIFKQEAESVDVELKRLKALCDDIYIGVMPSSFLYETICEEVLELSKKQKIKLLPVSKSSYLKRDDELVYMSLLKISETNNFLGLDDLHLKTKEELEAEFSEISYVFDNLNEFLSKIEDELITMSNPLPKFPNKMGILSKDYLRGLCKKG